MGKDKEMSRARERRRRKRRQRGEKIRGLWYLIPIWTIIVLMGLFLLTNAVNYGVSLKLRHYIRSFDPVDYSGTERIGPEKDPGLGYYTFTADRDFRIMVLTDIHIGAGIMSMKADRKAIREIAAMLQQEKPDLVVLDGDNTFAVPGPVYNGGGTLNNRMAARDVIELFEHMGVYYTTVFGNHDTEVFGYTNRTRLGELYKDEKFRYCIFEPDYTDEEKLPSVSNQIILLRNTKGEISKCLLMIDSNAYVDDSVRAVINWEYDVIRDGETEWAAGSISKLGDPKTVAFFHIPTSEYRIAYEELEANGFKDTENTKYISGVWDELVDEDTHSRIWHGGIANTDVPLADLDSFFERLGPDGLNVLEACYCGHDHVNNAVVNYRGVDLCYCYSIDNLAYEGIAESGLQRGATIVTISPDGSRTTEYKNAYRDYGLPANLGDFKVYTDRLYYKGEAPKGAR